MKITIEWLTEKSACVEGREWFLGQKETDVSRVAQKLMRHCKFDWANWLVTRAMTYSQRVAYAIFAAECVIEIYEKAYPNDRRPRSAIEAAKKCLEAPTQANKDAAYAAADAANAANAANAAYAAYAAADAAYAANAANAADAAYAAARTKLQRKILNFGLRLLSEKIRH